MRACQQLMLLPIKKKFYKFLKVGEICKNDYKPMKIEKKMGVKIEGI